MNFEQEVDKLNSMVVTLYNQGKYAEAIPLAERAVALAYRYLGEEHPDYAQSLNNLALLYDEMGRYDEAEPLFKKAMEIRRRVLGEEHPYYATSLNNLASLYREMGRYDEAFHLLWNGVQIENRLLLRLAGAYPEPIVLAFAARSEVWVWALLTLILHHFSDKPECVQAGLDAILPRKAIGYEVALVQQQAALSGKYPHLRETFERLRRVRQELATRALRGPAEGESMSDFQRRMAMLEQEQANLEMELAREVPEVEWALRMRSADRQAVASSLPEGCTLVEFYRFAPCRFEAKRGEVHWEPERYVAFVLEAGSEQVKLVDLGEAEEIDAKIREFRRQVGWEEPLRGSVGSGMPELIEDACRALYDSLFMPVVSVLGEGIRHLMIAPDGELSLVPFEAFLSDEGRFVVEGWQVSYVTVGRDVLFFRESSVSSEGALIVADPDYDLHEQEVVHGLIGRLLGRHDVPVSSCAVSSAELRAAARGYWAPLPSTREEGEAVRDMLEAEGVKVVAFWLGEEALEGRLKRVSRPKVLHIATHGFFFPDAPRSVYSQMREQLIGEVRGFGMRGLFQQVHLVGSSPLVRSGLVLAGINSLLREPPLRVPPEAEDAVLTALDVSALDLLGTELVVLSACETGVGDVRRGQGVLGLRRAFLLAGAKTVLTSLWKVPDEETKELMKEFYKRVLSGCSKGEALREAQLALIAQLRERDGYAHPFYWASFICVGDTSPMK
jgi:CHAT domain-containing protein